VHTPRRWQVASAVTGLLLGSAVVAVAATGHDPGGASVTTQQPGAWLLTGAPGDGSRLTRVNGPEGQLEAQVPLPPTLRSSGRPTLTETDKGLVVRGPDGATALLDAARVTVRPGPSTPPTDPAASDQVADDRGAYFVDRSRGRVTYLDGTTAVTTGPFELGAGLTRVVVDREHHAWVARPADGLVVGFEHGREFRRVRVSAGHDLQLAAADGRALLLDATAQSRQALSTTGVSSSAPAAVPAPGPQATATATATSRDAQRPLVATVDRATGQLTLTDTETGRATTVALGPGAYGEPLVTRDAVFVPDDAHGRVVVVDPATQTVLPPRPFAADGTHLELVLGRDGMVYANDPAGSRALVYSADGAQVREVVTTGDGTLPGGAPAPEPAQPPAAPTPAAVPAPSPTPAPAPPAHPKHSPRPKQAPAPPAPSIAVPAPASAPVPAPAPAQAAPTVVVPPVPAATGAATRTHAPRHGKRPRPSAGGGGDGSGRGAPAAPSNAPGGAPTGAGTSSGGATGGPTPSAPASSRPPASPSAAPSAGVVNPNCPTKQAPLGTTTYPRCDPPGAPTITAKDSTDTTVSITWAKASSEAPVASYEVNFSPGGSTTVDGSTTSASRGGLPGDTAVSFTVTAVNAEGTAGASAADNIMTKHTPAPAAAPVSGVGNGVAGAANNNTCDVPVRWNPAANAVRYAYDYGTGRAETTATSAIVTGVCGTAVQFYALGINADGVDGPVGSTRVYLAGAPGGVNGARDALVITSATGPDKHCITWDSSWYRGEVDTLKYHFAKSVNGTITPVAGEVDNASKHEFCVQTRYTLYVRADTKYGSGAWTTGP